MSGTDIDNLMKNWAAIHPKEGGPFSSHGELYSKIDSIQDGDAPWKSKIIHHPNADSPDAPAWQVKKYVVWYRDPKAVIKNILSNSDFKDGIDYAPCKIYDKKQERNRRNFMSADWAWNQCASETSFDD